MSIRQRMKNYVYIAVKGVDLSTASNIEFYLRQDDLFFQYAPEVVSSSGMVVEIPFADAMKLKQGDCKVQFALTDENGTPFATDQKPMTVGELLKEAGYAGI